MGFVISALGGFLVILSLVDMTYTFRGWNPVRVMGQSPLLIYVLHSIIIGRIFARWWGSEKLDNMKFLLVYALFVAGMIGAAFIMSAVRKRTYYTRLHSANGSAQLGKRP
jgi:fucose 4-O-acetylase-like acetyltransferase